MPRPTLLAVSHGTSDADGARAIAELVHAVAERLSDVDVRAAFVDVQEPDAVDALAAVVGPVVIVPLLLSSGFHVHHDLHGMADPRADAVVAAPLGPDRRLAAVLAERLPPASDQPVILAVAGSRDPRSLTDAEAMATVLREHLGRRIELAYLAARQPDLPTALAEHPDAVVSTYLLARGYFFDLAERVSADRPLALPLLDGGPVPGALVDLVVARYEEAVDRLSD
ncbi:MULTISPECIES: sirohydrochlorin chelatase [unclassified Microbacterium]|uniref:sirohydrochlorin chelatase n=1 Tax=unclassified Microbacterium TaxID=2609290 RepID=UPI000EA9E802|nr:MULTISPECIES: CbiX/SirB N-terminal domain-containing protein [unclassified Microbacterium]MBT2483851.1 cobalamin biosynthesis protein CbiX [Microbacterium sp. ISL-108]RKN66833.1 cobalamin biosynthesis protein CbiX [Microbacterium sp. CGR2]